jgi:hypothetical protein
VTSSGPTIVCGGGMVGGRHQLLQLRARRCQHARRVPCRYPEHGREFGQADSMAVDQVEYLPVSAWERIECRPDPAVAAGVTALERELSGPVSGNVVISRV